MILRKNNKTKAVVATVLVSSIINVMNVPVFASGENNRNTEASVTINSTIGGSLIPVELKTSVGIAPVLPEKVTINNGDVTEEINVQWEVIDDSKYANAGAFTVYGQVDGVTEKAKANVTVIEGDGPLLSFEVISDSHVTNNINGTYSVNLDKALKDFKSINEATEAKSKGLMLNGDVTDNGNKAQWDVYKQVLEANGMDTSEVYETYGNHDTWTWGLTFEKSLELFYDYTGTDSVYFDEWMSGYHFIFLGTEKKNGNNAWLSETQLQWFEEKLAEGAEDGKPIFVFLHQGLVDTAAGTKAYQGWSGVDQDAEMREIIAKYPQTMLFSGHSHWELQSDDSVFNEGNGTFVNTASSAYLWSDAGKTINGSEGWLLDVYEDKVVLKGRNLTDQEWIEEAQYTVNYGEEGYSAHMSNVDNVEGKAGAEIKVQMAVNAFPTDKTMRSTEMIFELPEDVELKEVELNNKSISAKNWDYNVVDGTLRVALADLEGNPIFASSIPGEKNVVTLTLELKEDKATGDVTTVKMPTMVVRCEDEEDVVYDTKKAVSTITFVEKEVAQVFPRELYASTGDDIIPNGYKAYAIEFTGVKNSSNITLVNGDGLHYSPEFTEQNGKLTYVTLVSEDVEITKLADISSYVIDENKDIDSTVVFGDIKADGIDAQDALAAVTTWLRKSEIDNKGILTLNVSADGKVNTRDAIDIVDNYIEGKEFKVLTK